MCGDMCIHKKYPCSCGEFDLTYEHTQYQCCLRPGDRCTVEIPNKSCDETMVRELHPNCPGGRRVCKSGQVTHKSEPCHGSCSENDNLNSSQEDLKCGYTDHCNYSAGYFMCGDVCTHNSHTERCFCDDIHINSGSSGYCCLEPRKRCKVTENEQQKKNITCSYAKVVHKSENCEVSIKGL